MLTIEELHNLGNARCLETERERLAHASDALQEPIAKRLFDVLRDPAPLPLGFGDAVLQFPAGFYRSELRTALIRRKP